MKFLIQESTLENLLRRMLEKEGLDRTMMLTGLDAITLIRKVEPFPINSEMAYELIYTLFNEDKVLTKEIGTFTLRFSYDGILEWYHEDGPEKMFALCTPYWDGDTATPIQNEYYSFKGEEIYNEKYSTFKGPEEFLYISELIEWYEKKYIPTVYKILKGFLVQYRELFKNSGI